MGGQYSPPQLAGLPALSGPRDPGAALGERRAGGRERRRPAVPRRPRCSRHRGSSRVRQAAPPPAQWQTGRALGGRQPGHRVGERVAAEDRLPVVVTGDEAGPAATSSPKPTRAEERSAAVIETHTVPCSTAAAASSPKPASARGREALDHNVSGGDQRGQRLPAVPGVRVEQHGAADRRDGRSAAALRCGPSPPQDPREPRSDMAPMLRSAPWPASRSPGGWSPPAV
jgi:hypothetical protein